MLLAAWLWLSGPPTSVEWEAPAECPSAAEVEARVDELRGESRLDAPLHFVVEGHGPHVLRVVGQAGSYEAAECEALVETALLLVALALVPTETSNTETSATQTSAGPVDAGGEAEDVGVFLRGPAARSRPRPRLPPPRSGKLQVELGMTTGITPRPAGDLSLVAGPRTHRVALDLGLITRPSFAGDSPLPEVNTRLWTVGGLARVCVGGSLRHIALAGCAGLEAAAVQARAYGAVVAAEPSTRPWLLAELGPLLSVPASPRVALTMRVVGHWLAVQPDFRVAGAGRVCCVDVLGVAARVGVDFGLGR